MSPWDGCVRTGLFGRKGETAYKVACWHDEPHLVADLEVFGLLRQSKVRLEVVDNLGQYPGEVDRVDSSELEVLVGLGVAKQRLDDVLCWCEYTSSCSR